VRPIRSRARAVPAVALAIALVASSGVAVLLADDEAVAEPVVAVAPSTELVDLEEVALATVRDIDPEIDRSLLRLARDDRAEEGPDEAPAEPQAGDSARLFAEEFPAHAAARQVEGDPATFHWAVIAGVNDYAGPTGDTLGSVADAMVLRDILIDRGWRPDHVLVLTDRQADHDRTVRALEWLARSTDERSTVVFSSSGHIRHSGGRTGLWPSDNRYIWSEDLGRMLGAIASDRMWISLQGCHAGGLAAPGVEGPGRVVTYSSPVTQKSYEDPETGHSLQGYYVFAEGIRDGWGDADGDGRVSVQEAWAWGAPRAETRSAWQQKPVMVDGLGAPFHLEVGA
jgi:hypothetical protein